MINSTQRGVFRINCIDCLDRTNVVQGLLAKRMLHIQLIVIILLYLRFFIHITKNLPNFFFKIET